MNPNIFDFENNYSHVEQITNKYRENINMPMTVYKKTPSSPYLFFASEPYFCNSIKYLSRINYFNKILNLDTQLLLEPAILHLNENKFRIYNPNVSKIKYLELEEFQNYFRETEQWCYHISRNIFVKNCSILQIHSKNSVNLKKYFEKRTKEININKIFEELSIYYNSKFTQKNEILFTKFLNQKFLEEILEYLKDISFITLMNKNKLIKENNIPLDITSCENCGNCHTGPLKLEDRKIIFSCENEKIELKKSKFRLKNALLPFFLIPHGIYPILSNRENTENQKKASNEIWAKNTIYVIEKETNLSKYYGYNPLQFPLLSISEISKLYNENLEEIIKEYTFNEDNVIETQIYLKIENLKRLREQKKWADADEIRENLKIENKIEIQYDRDIIRFRKIC